MWSARSFHPVASCLTRGWTLAAGSILNEDGDQFPWLVEAVAARRKPVQ
jgi:hypothetical protein